MDWLIFIADLAKSFSLPLTAAIALIALIALLKRVDRLLALNIEFTYKDFTANIQSPPKTLPGPSH